MTILTVSQLNTYIKSVIDYDQKLKNIYLSGEISNLKIHYSGHIYFTLKDEKSEIRAVMFKNASLRLKFRPENGMNILARGNVTVYDAKGQYQLICDDMQPDGIGALTIAFEQLKIRLHKEGLFDEERKKPIPSLPEKIGVITASTGAAVHDILSILERRFPLAEIYFVPVAVQGNNAAPEISKAIKRLNQTDCDVIILGRGGGSVEDLWAFNEESVARSIFESRIPIVSAVGHETDFTISDFVADLRAATPSAAAELCSSDWHDLVFTIDSFQERIIGYFKQKIADYEAGVGDAEKIIEINKPLNLVIDQQRSLDYNIQRIYQSSGHLINNLQNQLELFVSILDSHNPARILSRGFAYVTDDKGKHVSGIGSVGPNDVLTIQFYDGKATVTVTDTETANNN